MSRSNRLDEGYGARTGPPASSSGYSARGGYGSQYADEYSQGNPYASEAAPPLGPPQQTRGGNQMRDPQQGRGGNQGRDYDRGYGQPYAETRYGANAGNNYEMASMPQTRAAPRDDMGTFLQDVEDLRAAVAHMDENVSRIENLHQRSLNEISEEQGAQTQRQLDALTAETSQLMNNLKNRIKALQARSHDNARKSQSEALTNKFKQTVQRYQVMEANYRQRYKDRMGRQYRIVRPDAGEDEVRAAVDDNQGGQIFSQALLQSNRRGEASSALREVQARHQDIQKIERTMAELAQLFQEMAVMVEQQDPVVTQIQEQSEQTQDQLSKGVDQTNQAVKSARAARRKKWICLGIVVLIIIILALVLGLVFGIQKKG